MQKAFRALLTGSAAVTALAPALRIEWGRRTQGAGYPAVQLGLVDGADGLTLDGPDGWFSGRVQVDCYALEYAEALELAEAVKAELHGHAGDGFQLIQAERMDDFSESGAADLPFRFSLDFFTIWEGN